MNIQTDKDIKKAHREQRFHQERNYKFSNPMINRIHRTPSMRGK